MKKSGFVISIMLCFLLCANLMPVYGAETLTQENTETIDAVLEMTEHTGQIVDIKDEPEMMPLTPPAGIRTSLVVGKYIKLTWNKVYGASGYEIYRSLSKDGTYQLIASVAGNTFTDKAVYSGRAYYYKVRACKADDAPAGSGLSVPAVYYMKPAAPVITAKNNNGHITVSWKNVYGAQKYYVYIYSSKKGRYLKVGETASTSLVHKKGVKNAFLQYSVCAVYEKDGKTIMGDKSKYVKILSRYVDPEKKMVALTFDDGPSKYTKSIVQCLYKYDSAATFFVVGNRVNNYKETVRYTYNRGCELANHSYSHPILTKLTSDKIKTQIRKTDNRIKAITGEKPVLVRVPGGGYNSKVKKAVGKPVIQWSDDTLDWKTRSKSATVNYVMKHVSDGDIILMHDLHEPTKNAALALIPKLKKKGYQIVTVSELAKYKGYDLKKGTVYFSFR